MESKRRITPDSKRKITKRKRGMFSKSIHCCLSSFEEIDATADGREKSGGAMAFTTDILVILDGSYYTEGGYLLR